MGALLLAHLVRPQRDLWRRFADAVVFAWTASGPFVDESSADRLEDVLCEAPNLATATVPCQPSKSALNRHHNDGCGALLARLPVGCKDLEMLERALVVVRLFDEADQRAKRDFEGPWRRALHTLTLLQGFSGRLRASTSERA